MYSYLLVKVLANRNLSSLQICCLFYFYNRMQGIEQFRCALEVAPQNVSAHFGLAYGLLGMSKECASSGAFGWGASLLEVSH